MSTWSTFAASLATGLLLAGSGPANAAPESLAEDAPDSRSIAFLGRTLSQVLRDYERAGVPLVYARSSIQSRASFAAEPAAAGPVVRLRAALAPLGLGLERYRGKAWLIVRQAPVAQAMPDAARSATERPLEELIVVSSRYRLGDDAAARSQRIDRAQLLNQAELGDDALRVAAQLPGAATLGLSAKPHFRGGLQDELLVRYNNIELLEPFHLRDFQSVFSGLNPSLIESVDVYTGGFPVRYGNRMSAVMDITPSAPTAPFEGELLVSLLTTGATLQGLHGNGRREWSLSARRGNLDFVTQQINDSVGRPAYGDWTGTYRWALAPSVLLDIGFIGFNDNVSLQDFDTDGEIAESTYRNLYGWAQLQADLSDKLSMVTALSAGRVRHRREGFLLDEDLDNGEATLSDRRRIQLWRLQQQWRYVPGIAHTIELGGELQYQSARYHFDARIERGLLADFLDLPVSVTRRSSVDPRGLSAGAYLSWRWLPAQWLALESGLRLDVQNFGEQSARHQVSPRFSLRADLRRGTRLRLSGGRFQQPEGIHELAVSDGLTAFQPTQRADHYILSVEQSTLANTLTLRAEFFYKKFSNPKVRFENLFNPLVLLPELASDRVRIAPERARTRGYELSARYQPSDRIRAWLSIGESQAEDRIDGRWLPRTWDQGTTLNAGLQWARNGWSLGLSWQRHEGWRTTALPARVDPDQPPDLNVRQDRLPAYSNLNLRLAREWQGARQSVTLFAEVTNLADRRNVGGIEYELEEPEDEDDPDVGTGLIDVAGGPETLLPRVPSIGIVWRF